MNKSSDRHKLQLEKAVRYMEMLSVFKLFPLHLFSIKSQQKGKCSPELLMVADQTLGGFQGNLKREF